MSSIFLMWCYSLFASAAETSAPRYLALGDSYTIGEGVEQKSRWPVLLKKRLDTLGIPIGAANIIARTGWRTDDLYNATQSRIKPSEPSYDLITLMIGVNDQYQGVDITTFTLNLETLIKRAISLSGGETDRILLISIPDWGFSPYGQSINRNNVTSEIDSFNDVLKSMANKYHLAFADVTGISRQVNPQDFTDDGLHPSQQQYQRWIDKAILPKVRNIL